MPAYRRRIPWYRQSAIHASADKPMSEMNTTPLIDVLLVLLIMIIMTIPIAAHKLDVDLPVPGPDTATGDAVQISLTINPSGQVFWDGEAVNRAQLQVRLDEASLLAPEPVIRFQPNPQASYDASVQVIAQVADAGLEKFAFIGNHEYSTFGRE